MIGSTRLSSHATLPSAVCEAVESLLQVLLGTTVHERCERKNGARCCFEVALTADPS